MLQRRSSPLPFVVLAVLFAGCESAKPTAVEAPPRTVTVSKPVPDTITDAEEFTGRTEAVDSVLVRARVSGYLDKVNFKEGAEVKKGQVLFEIDPRPYQATLDQAEGKIKLYEAQL